MLVDAHTHIAKYENNIDSVIHEIKEYQIFTLSNSMDVFAYEKNLKIAEMCDLILPTFGIHPWAATQHSYKLERLTEYINHSPMIGETGLDFHFAEDSSQYPHQFKVFEYFLEFARDQKKIMNLHTKGAEQEVLKYLNDYEINRSIIHWYSGPLKLIEEFLMLDSYFTIGVEVLTSKKIQKIAKTIPNNRLLTETDNPGGYQWLKNETGMPGHIKLVVDKLAEIKNVTIEEIVDLVKQNLFELIIDDEHIDINYKKMLSGNL